MKDPHGRGSSIIVTPDQMEDAKNNPGGSTLMISRRHFLRALVAVPAALTVAGKMKFPAPNPHARAYIPAKNLYGRIMISGEVMKHSTPGAFAMALNFEIERLRADFMRVYNQELKNDQLHS